MENTKLCKMCKEEIKEDALKCKHCGEILYNSITQPKRRTGEGLFLKSMNFGCGMIIFFIVAVIVIALLV